MITVLIDEKISGMEYSLSVLAKLVQKYFK